MNKITNTKRLMVFINLAKARAVQLIKSIMSTRKGPKGAAT